MHKHLQKAAGEQMASVTEIHFAPEALAAHGLPDIGYPISVDLLSGVISGGGNLPLGYILAELQNASASGDADWRRTEPARARLSELLAPDDPHEVVTAAGPDWWLEIAQVDLDAPVITIERDDELISTVQKRDDGTLRIAGYRPLDRRSARLLIHLALPPHPQDGTVCMRASNWEYALDCAASSGQTYAALGGQSYLTLWPQGIGGSATKEGSDNWRGATSQRKPTHVAVELGVAYALADD